MTVWEPRAGLGPAGPHREWTAEPVSTGVSGPGVAGAPLGGLRTRDGLAGDGGVTAQEHPPRGGGGGLGGRGSPMCG